MNPESKIEKIKEILPILKENLKSCTLCPRNCRVNRTIGETGHCGMKKEPVIASINLHYGEEPPISGQKGSGTVFLSGCPLHCVFCQNFPISQLRNGTKYSIEEAGEKILRLQRLGAHNLNFVTPTHYSAAIMEILLYAFERGLNIPIVYNTSGYERVEILKMFEGIIDIYLPDMKYADNEIAVKFSTVGDYPEINRAAVTEIFRQVGAIPEYDDKGIMKKGAVIRHLVLPGYIENSIKVLKYIEGNFGSETYLSLMNQYFPAYKVHSCYPEINRKVTYEEWEEILDTVDDLELSNGWIQDFEH